MNCDFAQNWNMVGFSSYNRYCTLIWVEKRPNIFNLGKARFRKFPVPHVKICYVFTSNWGKLKHHSCTACRLCKLNSFAKLKTTTKHSNSLESTTVVPPQQKLKAFEITSQIATKETHNSHFLPITVIVVI